MLALLLLPAVALAQHSPLNKVWHDALPGVSFDL